MILRHALRLTLLVLMFLVPGGMSRAADSAWQDENGKPAPETEFRRSKNGFGGWLVITSDADWEAKWNTSPNTVPHFTTTSTVLRGKSVTILVFFVNAKVDNQQNADVTLDVQSTRPDASISINEHDVTCIRGKLLGDPANIRLAPAVIKFIGEPKDPAGKWTIRVTLKDNLRQVHLPLTTSFTLK